MLKSPNHRRSYSIIRLHHHRDHSYITYANNGKLLPSLPFYTQTYLSGQTLPPSLYMRTDFMILEKWMTHHILDRKHVISVKTIIPLLECRYLPMDFPWIWELRNDHLRTHDPLHYQCIPSCSIRTTYVYRQSYLSSRNHKWYRFSYLTQIPMGAYNAPPLPKIHRNAVWRLEIGVIIIYIVLVL